MIEMLLGAGLTLVGFAVGRFSGVRERKSKQPKPVCICKHGVNEHEGSEGACHAQEPHDKYDGDGFRGKEMGQCTCRKYVGREAADHRGVDMTETSEPTTSVDPAFRAASLAVQATWSPKGDDVAVTRSSEYANYVVEVVERAFLDNGWRPPLPEVMYDAGETAEEAVRRLAAEVVGLRQELSSLPDSETEWGIRPVGQGEVEETGAEEWARAVSDRMPTLYVTVSRRAAGPWVEVPRG